MGRIESRACVKQVTSIFKLQLFEKMAQTVSSDDVFQKGKYKKTQKKQWKWGVREARRDLFSKMKEDSALSI